MKVKTFVPKNVSHESLKGGGGSKSASCVSEIDKPDKSR